MAEISVQEVFDKAFSKAKANGWKPEDTHITFISFNEMNVPVNGVLFDHAFAKALWGEDEVTYPFSDVSQGRFYKVPRYKEQLARMAIDVDPIQYLSENI